MWKPFKYLFLLLFLAALAMGGAAWWFVTSPLRFPGETVRFTIAPGSSVRAAARQIIAAGVEMPAPAFELLARVMGRTLDIKAGQYELARGATPVDLLEKLARGDFALADVRIIEGATFKQIRAALDANPIIRHDTLGKTDSEVMQLLGLEGSPEGRFFPDTYRVAHNAADLEVLRTAYAAMQKHLSTAWEQRAPDLPVANVYEALILASIVEKETGRPEDRGMVAGVLANRLRSGMPLQTDPTVIYGLGDRFDGNLRRRDLEADGPYNTYTRGGLPPTPIATPGLASLQAATNPARTDALYFVARGDGSSHFSRSLPEHNRAVRKYQLGGR